MAIIACGATTATRHSVDRLGEPTAATTAHGSTSCGIELTASQQHLAVVATSTPCATMATSTVDKQRCVVRGLGAVANKRAVVQKPWW